jgi:hypothetical protein
LPLFLVGVTKSAKKIGDNLATKDGAVDTFAGLRLVVVLRASGLSVRVSEGKSSQAL